MTPPKKPFTPFFNLEVVYSPNSSLIGWWATTQDYGSYIGFTPNVTERSTFYQSANYTNREHPEGGSVLVHNVTDAVPDNVAGTPYTPRNLIAGTSGCLTCDASGLPIVASVFTKSQEQWTDFGSWQLDFKLGEFSHEVFFNVTEGGALSGWTKTQACFFDVGGSIRSDFIVTNELYPEQCSPVDLRWTFAGF